MRRCARCCGICSSAAIAVRLHLYWGAQTRADLYEDEMLRDMTRRFPNLTYTPVLSDPNAIDDWQGRTGWVHSAALEDHPQLNQFDVYASGPPIMVEAIRQQFIESGLPPDQLFFDSFDFAPDALEKQRQAIRSPGSPSS